MNEADAVEAPAITQPDWMSMARDAHSSSTTYFDSSIRKQIINSLRQWQGQHPEGSKYYSEAYQGRSKLFRPKTRSMVRKNEAVAAEAFFSTINVINIAPEDETDDQQVAAAEFMQGLLQRRLTHDIPWFLIAIGAYQDSMKSSVVVSYQYWKYDEKRGVDAPCVDLIPVENLRIDPASDWKDPINSSPYVIHEIPMYIKDVRARMRVGKWKKISPDGLTKAANRTMDSIRAQRERQRQDSKDQVSAITDYSIVWVHRNIVEVDGKDWLFYTLGVTDLLSDPVPLREAYLHDIRPYVMGFCVLETHTAYPSDPVKLSGDVQAEINEMANSRIDNIKLALAGRHLAKRSKQVDIRSLTRVIPGSVTLVDELDDVKLLDVPDVTSSAYSEQDRLNLDFDDVTGAFSQSSVQSNRQLNETVGGMNILTTNANQVSGYQLRTFVETWMEPVLRQLAKLEAHYETDERVMELVGRKTKILDRYQIESFEDMLDAESIVLTVDVGMGATNPQTKITNLQAVIKMLREILADGVLERYDMNSRELIREVMGMAGYRDGGRFFKLDGDEDPRIAALTAEIQELKRQIEAKMPPELLAATVAKIQSEVANNVAKQVETGVKSAYAAMQAAQAIAAVPEIAPIADAVMQSAGYQQPNPAGVDPNFPMPGEAEMGYAADKDVFGTNTSPMLPDPPDSGLEGAQGGIETIEQDL